MKNMRYIIKLNVDEFILYRNTISKSGWTTLEQNATVFDDDMDELNKCRSHMIIGDIRKYICAIPVVDKDLIDLLVSL